MIETWDLGKTFYPPSWPVRLLLRRLDRPIRALQGITLQIERAEVFGLLGPNGAGKSTLLKLLATLLIPSEGRARVLGQDLVRQAGGVRRAVGLAAGDERGFYWRLSGRENLEFFAGLQGLSPRLARYRVDAALDLMDLRPEAKQIVALYSTGMRQRLGIARALLGDPVILLLDEPTRSLDPVAATRILDLIKRTARDEGKTILLATHQLGEAAAVCDRVAVLAGGTARGVFAPGVLGEQGLTERYRTLVGVVDDPHSPTAGVS